MRLSTSITTCRWNGNRQGFRMHRSFYCEELALATSVFLFATLRKIRVSFCP